MTRTREEKLQAAREHQQRWRAAHPEKVAAIKKAWSERNREHRTTQQAEYRDQLRHETQEQYGPTCRACGATGKLGADLQLDHVDGGGALHRMQASGSKTRGGWPFYRWLRKQKWPTGLQVLCKPCHAVKTRTDREYSEQELSG